MQKIDVSQVHGWHHHSQLLVPEAISVSCPHCGSSGVFTCVNFVHDPPRGATVCSGKCSKCRAMVHFWSFGLSQRSAATEVMMYPSNAARLSAPEMGEAVPAALQRALLSTIESYNSGNFVATSMGCRRTIEGIFKYVVPKDQRKKNLNLEKLIELALEKFDAAAPLRQLSHAIRDGGNLGAHFDEDVEPTEPMARQMLELLEYLISYLYILPSRITALEKSIDQEPLPDPDNDGLQGHSG